jgi:hypothetical protein
VGGDEAGIFLNYAGPGNVVRRNTVTGVHDGIGAGRQSSETDAYENVVSECMGDGIHTDEEPGYNIRVFANTIRRCYNGISVQGIFRGQLWNAGPLYFFRNLVEGGRDPQGRTDRLGGALGYDGYLGFKVGSSVAGTGRVYFIHNTVSILGARTGNGGIQSSGGAFFSNAVSRNNLWRTGQKAFNLKHRDSATGHDFDCDNLHDYVRGGVLVQWSNAGGPSRNGRYPDFEVFRAHTGQEANGISTTATLLNPDFTLQAGSPEVDAGCVVPGFNDGGRWRSLGAGPDIGAFERTVVP